MAHAYHGAICGRRLVYNDEGAARGRRKNSVKPRKGERKRLQPRSFAPAGACLTQHPIRELAPPAPVSWPLRGCGE
jgi:hypothetical protein